MTRAELEAHGCEVLEERPDGSFIVRAERVGDGSDGSPYQPNLPDACTGWGVNEADGTVMIWT